MLVDLPDTLKLIEINSDDENSDDQLEGELEQELEKDPIEDPRMEQLEQSSTLRM